MEPFFNGAIFSSLPPVSSFLGVPHSTPPLCRCPPPRSGKKNYGPGKQHGGGGGG